MKRHAHLGVTSPAAFLPVSQDSAMTLKLNNVEEEDSQIPPSPHIFARKMSHAPRADRQDPFTQIQLQNDSMRDLKLTMKKLIPK